MLKIGYKGKIDFVQIENLNDCIPEVLLYDRKRRVTIRERALLAYDTEAQRGIAVGEEANEAMATGNPDVILKNPFRDGEITEFEDAAKLFRYYVVMSMRKINMRFRKPRILMCNLRHDLSEVQMKAYSELGRLVMVR